MATLNLDEMEMYINIIRDETVEGSELEMQVERLKTLIDGLNEVWDAPKAVQARESLLENLNEFKKAKFALNNNGRVICDHANRMIEINS